MNPRPVTHKAIDVEGDADLVLRLAAKVSIDAIPPQIEKVMSKDIANHDKRVKQARAFLSGVYVLPSDLKNRKKLNRVEHLQHQAVLLFNKAGAAALVSLNSISIQPFSPYEKVFPQTYRHLLTVIQTASRNMSLSTITNEPNQQSVTGNHWHDAVTAVHLATG